MMFKLRSFLGMSEQDVIEPVLPEAIEGVRMDYQAVLEKAQENNSFSKNIMRRQLESGIMMWRPPRETVEVLTCLPPWVIPVRICPCEELTTR